MFTKEELQAIFTLLQRVQITGQESGMVATLLQKVAQQIRTEMPGPKLVENEAS